MEGLSQLVDVAHDGDSVFGHVGVEPSDPSSGDADEPVSPLTRTPAVAGKRPFFPDPEEDDSSDLAQDAGRVLTTPNGSRAFIVDANVGPDLGGYLDCFGMPVRERVLLCRSFASYLVAQGQTGIRRPGPKKGFKAPRRV